MIGNLMLAVSTALFSGVLALGEYNASQVPQRATEYGGSHVFKEQETTIYESYSVVTSLSQSYVDLDEAIHCYKFSTNSWTIADLSSYATNFFLYDYFKEEGNVWSITGDTFEQNGLDMTSMYLLWQRSTFFDNDGNQYNSLIRILIPYGFNHDGVEFCIRNASNGIYGQFAPYVDARTTYFISNSEFGTFYNWFAINNLGYNASVTYTNPSTTIRRDDYLTDTFLCFYIGYNTTASNGSYSFSFQLDVVDYKDLGGSYTNGYSAGYFDGKKDGYAEGYSQGLSLSEQGTFGNLFNSIADTPLRFIYGLFNFDLFGISMLVIIMSLLTATIVFALVKKIWK